MEMNENEKKMWMSFYEEYKDMKEAHLYYEVRSGGGIGVKFVAVAEFESGIDEFTVRRDITDYDGW